MALQIAYLLTSVMAGAGQNSSGPKTILIEDGKARCEIVIPDQASPTVRYAAEELARYLKKMSGADVPIVSERRAGDTCRIGIGLPKTDQSPDRGRRATNLEMIAIRSDAGGVTICGGSDRATLYGVYRFLETALGCRWLAPGGHEHVPARRTVSVGKISMETAPKFQLRTFSCKGDPDVMSWGLKVGLNGFFDAEAAKRNGGCYYLPKQLPGCHTWYRVIPKNTYFKTHPEWYPLIGGTRTPTKLHSSQLCVTAPGLADEFARNIIKIFDADPSLQLTSISPNDGYGWCECEQCMALDRKLCKGRTTRQGLAKPRPFRGDRVFWFANQVAQRVAKKHPDKLLLVLAYVNYAEPPDTVRPLPNVVPWLCHYAPADYSRPIADPSSEPNTQFNALLTSWAKIAPHLLIYSYVSKSMWWELPRPVTRTFAADVKHLHALGVHRYYAQSRLSDWTLDGPLYYVIAKLLWDPSGDPDEIARDWIDHMFGRAAPHMAAFYQAVEDSVRKSGRSYSDNPPRDVPGLYVMADLDRAKQALSKAAESAADAATRDRIARITSKFTYGYHMIQSIESMERFRQEGDPAAMQQAEEYGKKALAAHKVAKAVQFVSSIRAFTEMGVVANGFGKAETLGGRRCWNSDETGVGDGRSGWASFCIRVLDPTRPTRLEMDVWGQSRLEHIVIQSRRGEWKPVKPQSKLSGEATWETMVYVIPPELLAPDKKAQQIGFGGGDSQVWVAAIRTTQPGK